MLIKRFAHRTSQWTTTKIWLRVFYLKRFFFIRRPSTTTNRFWFRRFIEKHRRKVTEVNRALAQKATRFLMANIVWWVRRFFFSFFVVFKTKIFFVSLGNRFKTLRTRNVSINRNRKRIYFQIGIGRSILFTTIETLSHFIERTREIISKYRKSKKKIKIISISQHFFFVFRLDFGHFTLSIESFRIVVKTNDC